MDIYTIWFDIKESTQDLELCTAIDAYLGHLAENGHIENHRLLRCKLGFNARGLGEFMLQIETRDLTQLDQAFQAVAPRSGETERLHGAVYSRIVNPQFALHRDFPDPQRAT